MGEGEARPLRIAGATDGEIRLGGEATGVLVPIDAPDQSLLVPLEEGGEPRVFLKLENVAATRPAGGYEVYVNLPEGEVPADPSDHFAGTLTLSDASEVLEITGAIRRVARRRDWSESELRLSFVPLSPVPEDEAATVGRIGVYRG